MDHLKEGIGLRGYGQRDPLREYQREAYALFEGMMNSVRDSVLMNIFRAKTEKEVRQIEEREKELQRRREAEAQAIHEQFGDEGSGSDRSEGLNRAERRRMAQKEKENDIAKDLPASQAAVGEEQVSGPVAKNAAKRRRKNRRKGR